MLKKGLLLFTITILLACSPSGEAQQSEKELNLKDNPGILDDQLVNEDGTINIALSDSSATLYNKAYQAHKADSIAPYYLMKAADIQRHIPGKALLAIKKYANLATDYPTHDLAAPATFMMGLTFDENLNDKVRAAKVYQKFINDFPNHELTPEAQNLLALASDEGSSDLEKVHEWQKQNNTSK